MGGPPTAAELLDRHAQGQKLTAKEWGIVGAARRWPGRPPKPPLPPPGTPGRGPGRPPKPRDPADPAPAGRPGPPTAADILAGDAPAAGDAGSQDVDSEMVRQVTKGFLTGVDQGLQQYTADLAAKIGADGRAIADYKKAVALPPVPAAALVEISPTLIAKTGLTAGQYAMTAGLAGLAPWVFMVTRTLQELSAAARRVTANPAPAQAPQAR